MKKVEKKFGIKFSSRHKQRGGVVKNTTLWYETEHLREQFYISYSNNPNYKNVKRVDKK